MWNAAMPTITAIAVTVSRGFQGHLVGCSDRAPVVAGGRPADLPVQVVGRTGPEVALREIMVEG